MAIKRDEELAASPLSNMIRNPHCMYHVPYSAAKPIVKKENGPGAISMELELQGSMASLDEEAIDALNEEADETDDDDDD